MEHDQNADLVDGVATHEEQDQHEDQSLDHETAQVQLAQQRVRPHVFHQRPKALFPPLVFRQFLVFQGDHQDAEEEESDVESLKG